MPTNINLHTDSPELYVAEAMPLDLVTALNQLDKWDDWACKVADYLFNAWVLMTCLRDNDQEGLHDLEFALHAALERTPAHTTLPEGWRARWEGYVALLEARLLLYSNSGDIENLLTRKHIKEVLFFLANDDHNPDTTQTQIRDVFKLSHERLSQVLRLLESHRLIQRRKAGKENLVYLTKEGRKTVNTLMNNNVVPLPISKPEKNSSNGKRPACFNADVLKKAA